MLDNGNTRIQIVDEQLTIFSKMCSIRTSSYSNNEDIHLCHIYNDFSQNPILGINQEKINVGENRSSISCVQGIEEPAGN